MNAKDLREANRLWPQCLLWSELQAELMYATNDFQQHPVSLCMLRDEITRRQRCSVYVYDKLAEAFNIVVDSPGWLPLAATAIGTPRPPGPRRTPSPRCESGKRPYCTCDTCY